MTDKVSLALSAIAVATAALLAIAAVILGYLTCTGRWRR